MVSLVLRSLTKELQKKNLFSCFFVFINVKKTFNSFQTSSKESTLLAVATSIFTYYFIGFQNRLHISLVQSILRIFQFVVTKHKFIIEDNKLTTIFIIERPEKSQDRSSHEFIRFTKSSKY